jgi:predicted nucleic acid-binding protein
MSFVVDASVALTWCFEDEAGELTDVLLQRLTDDDGAYAPSVWPLEVLNILLISQRRGRMSSEDRQEQLSFLHGLPITIDKDSIIQTWTVTNFLAERHNLTLYDASYLELAQRLKLPLATLDKELRKAANAVGIPLLGSQDN